MMKRPRGYTIIEALVMAAVALVVFGLLFNVFLVALQRTQDGRIRVDMQQQAVFTLVAWEKDLERTSQRAIRIQTGTPLYIGVTNARGVAGNGTVAWEETPTSPPIPCLARWCYDPTARTLSRGLYARGGNSVVNPTPSVLSGLTPIPGQEQRVFCKDVEEFSLKDRNGNTTLASQPLVFRLKLRRALSTSQRFAEFTVERRYTLRNSF